MSVWSWSSTGIAKGGDRCAAADLPGDVVELGTAGIQTFDSERSRKTMAAAARGGRGLETGRDHHPDRLGPDVSRRTRDRAATREGPRRGPSMATEEDTVGTTGRSPAGDFSPGGSRRETTRSCAPSPSKKLSRRSRAAFAVLWRAAGPARAPRSCTFHGAERDGLSPSGRSTRGFVCCRYCSWQKVESA